MQILRYLSLHKGLAYPLRQRYNAANRGTGLPARSTPADYKKPLSVPCHEGVQKAVLTTYLTTDSRGVCGNSVVKSCEERP